MQLLQMLLCRDNLIFKTDAGHVDKPKKFCQRSFAIYMDKPVGSRFGQMVIKSQGR